MAITDHDTVAGVAEALLAGRELGIVVVPGVELSTVTNDRDIHVLGYGFSLDDRKWLARLEELREGRNRRNERMLANLSRHGMPISPGSLPPQLGSLPARTSR